MMEEVCNVHGALRWCLVLQQRLFRSLIEQDCSYFDIHSPHEANLLLKEAGELSQRLFDIPIKILSSLTRVIG